jgi:hypothetical protein
MKHRRTIFHSRMGPVWIQQKACRDTFRRTCVFASGEICCLCSAFRCALRAKHRHNFFKLLWDRYGYNKKHVGTRYAELVFLHPVGDEAHVVHFVSSRARNVDALFFKLGWDRYGLHKKRAGTRYVKLVFLYPVGSAGHVVHFVASGAQNINALFFMFGLDRFGFNKKAPDTFRQNCVFASDGIYFSCSAFQCVRGVKHRRTDRYRFNKKHAGTCYAELVYLHLEGSAGHVVHSCASGRKTSMHDFSCLGGTVYGFKKNLTGTRYAKLLFLHLVGSVGHVVHSGASRA